jgi:hypothetical protein
MHFFVGACYHGLLLFIVDTDVGFAVCVGVGFNVGADVDAKGDAGVDTDVGFVGFAVCAGVGFNFGTDVDAKGYAGVDTNVGFAALPATAPGQEPASSRRF